MSEHKTVVRFADEPKPNKFFFQSPFRSWKFVLDTILLAVVSLGTALMLWNYRSGFSSFPVWVVVFFLLTALYPYWWALKRHARIYEHYRSNKIQQCSIEDPLNDLLEVADNSMNEGLRNSVALFGILLLVIYFSRWHPFK